MELALVEKKSVEVALVVVAFVVELFVTVKLEICTKEGRESVQVLSADRSCEPALEVICPAVPAMVKALVGSTLSLKVVQSVVDRQPKTEPEAVLHTKSKVLSASS